MILKAVRLTCTWRMTFASRLLHGSSFLTDSFATPSAMMRKILGRLALSGPRTMGLLLWREDGGKIRCLYELWFNRNHNFPQEVVLPFNEVTQEVKRVDGLLFVLVER